MRKTRNIALTFVCTALSPLMILAWPLLFGVGSGIGLYQRQKGLRLRRAAQEMTCSIDADCPPGFVCMGGWCVPERA